MAKFEKVSKFADARFPERKTAKSAGYDFYVAEDTLIPPYAQLHNELWAMFDPQDPRTLDQVAATTKEIDARPTLVPTGIKAKLDSDSYLELSVRSSCPLKYWLILANGVGIIDADYYNNSDNEGHIYFQLINLSPFPIILKKGDCIGQGIIKRYEVTEDDMATGFREGGFGSTEWANQPVLQSAT